MGAGASVPRSYNAAVTCWLLSRSVDALPQLFEARCGPLQHLRRVLFRQSSERRNASVRCDSSRHVRFCLDPRRAISSSYSKISYWSSSSLKRRARCGCARRGPQPLPCCAILPPPLRAHHPRARPHRHGARYPSSARSNVSARTSADASNCSRRSSSRAICASGVSDSARASAPSKYVSVSPHAQWVRLAKRSLRRFAACRDGSPAADREKYDPTAPTSVGIRRTVDADAVRAPPGGDQVRVVKGQTAS